MRRRLTNQSLTSALNVCQRKLCVSIIELVVTHIWGKTQISAHFVDKTWTWDSSVGCFSGFTMWFAKQAVHIFVQRKCNKSTNKPQKLSSTVCFGYNGLKKTFIHKFVGSNNFLGFSYLAHLFCHVSEQFCVNFSALMSTTWEDHYLRWHKQCQMPSQWHKIWVNPTIANTLTLIHCCFLENENKKDPHISYTILNIPLWIGPTKQNSRRGNQLLE